MSAMVHEARRRGSGTGPAVAPTNAVPGKRAATDALAPPRQQVAPSEDAGDDVDEDAGVVEGAIARFEGNPELLQVQAGFKVLAVGDTGRSVYAVQQALFDLGYRVSIHGVYNADTE